MCGQEASSGRACLPWPQHGVWCAWRTCFPWACQSEMMHAARGEHQTRGLSTSDSPGGKSAPELQQLQPKRLPAFRPTWACAARRSSYSSAWGVATGSARCRCRSVGEVPVRSGQVRSGQVRSGQVRSGPNLAFCDTWARKSKH